MVFCGVDWIEQLADGMSYTRYRFKRAAFFAGRRRAELLTHRRHEFLEAHQVQYPFEVVGQRGQAPFAPHFLQSLEQEVRVAKPALDGSKGMLGQHLPQLELLRLRPHPLRHRFHQMFVLLPRDRPVGLVPRASAFQRARLASFGPIISQLPPQFVSAEAMVQFRSGRTHIDIFLRVVLELALAI